MLIPEPKPLVVTDAKLMELLIQTTSTQLWDGRESVTDKRVYICNAVNIAASVLRTQGYVRSRGYDVDTCVECLREYIKAALQGADTYLNWLRDHGLTPDKPTLQALRQRWLDQMRASIVVAP